MLTPHRFEDTLQRFGCKSAPGLAQELLTAYSSPKRYYHNVAHIADCLGRLDEHRAHAKSHDEIELAIWFHDVVYDTHRSDNEELSAIWARRALESVELADEIIERVVAMVLATQHHQGTDRDMLLLVDIDLSILGAPPMKFLAYDDAIRKEYAWVSDKDYKAGRGKVLRAFLARDVIFQTSEFRFVFEQQARENIHAAIARLA